MCIIINHTSGSALQLFRVHAAPPLPPLTASGLRAQHHGDGPSVDACQRLPAADPAFNQANGLNALKGLYMVKIDS